MVLDTIKDMLGMKKKERHRGRKIAAGVAAGTAAVAGIVATAKKLHERGYDEKAKNLLHDAADNLKEEAHQLEEKIEHARKNRRTPDESLEDFRKKTGRKTKDEIKELAASEYGIELSTDDLKDEMLDQFINELKQR